MVKDRLVSGAIAGTIGGLIQAMYGFIVEALGFTDRTFTDFAKVLLMYRDYKGALAFIGGLIGHLTIGAMLGILFAYIIMITSNRYYLAKGFGYGAIIWVLFLGLGTIFKLPQFKDIPPSDVISTLVGSLLYGSITAYSLKMLDNRTKLL